MLARRLLGWDKWLHVLGIASPMNIGLLYAAGADSMDSKTYIIATAKRLYYPPPRSPRARVHASEEPWLKPSKVRSCPGCRRYESLNEMRRDTRALAIHNLYVLLEAAREASRACRNSVIWSLLVERAKRSPRLARAPVKLREAGGPRPCPHKAEPGDYVVGIAS